EPDRRGHRHHRICHQRQPGTRRVHIDDTKAVALLVIRRREHEAAVEAGGEQDRGRPGEPGYERAGQPVEVWRRAEAVKPGPVHLYSRLMRTAAAAASGASVMPSTVNAARKYIGPAIPVPAIA